MNDSVLLREATVQEIQLELIRRTTFNAFDGERIHASLMKHRAYWQAALLDRPGLANYQKPRHLLMSGLIALPLEGANAVRGECRGLTFWARLSGANATLATRPSWPRRQRRATPMAASHSRTVWSADPLALPMPITRCSPALRKTTGRRGCSRGSSMRGEWYKGQRRKCQFPFLEMWVPWRNCHDWAV
jgi:hypothetical protein